MLIAYSNIYYQFIAIKKMLLHIQCRFFNCRRQPGPLSCLFHHFMCISVVALYDRLTSFPQRGVTRAITDVGEHRQKLLAKSYQLLEKSICGIFRIEREKNQFIGTCTIDRKFNFNIYKIRSIFI